MRMTLVAVACLLLSGCTALPADLASAPGSADGALDATGRHDGGLDAARDLGDADLRTTPLAAVGAASSNEQGAADASPHASPPGRGRPGEHGDPQVVEGALVLEPNSADDPRFHVARTTFVQNDLGGARFVRTSVDMGPGALDVRTWEHGGYRLVIEAEGWGATERDARLAFESLQADLRDGLSSNGLAVVVESAYRAYHAGDQSLAVGAPYRSLSLTLYVPEDVRHEAALASSSADIGVAGLEGPRMSITTSTGDIRLEDVEAGRLAIDSPEGVVTMQNVSADTTTVQGGTYGLSVSGSDLGRLTAVELLDDVALTDVRLDGRIKTPGAVQGTVATKDLGIVAGSVDLDVDPVDSGGVRARTEDGAIDLDIVLREEVGLDARAETGLPTSVADVDMAGQVLQDDRMLLDLPQVHHVQSFRFEGHPVVFFVDGVSEQGDVRIQAPAAL